MGSNEGESPDQTMAVPSVPTRTVYTSNSIMKLNGSNFQAWKFQIKQVIANRKLNEVVYVKTTPVADEEKDSEARELISASLEPNVINQILVCETSNEMWSRLLSIYELKGEGNVECLLNRFSNLKMNTGEGVFMYIGRIEQLASEIKATGEPISERQIRARVIGGLSNKFDGFSRAWNATASSEKTLNNLIDRLVQDEADLSRRERKSDNTALLAKTGNQYRPMKKDKSKDKCRFCKQLGHWERECLKKRANQSSSNEHPSPTTRFHKKEFKKKTNQVAFMAKSNGEESNLWYVDSGASSHMTKDSSYLTNYQAYEVDRTINMGNGSTLVAKGEGTISFRSTLPRGERGEFNLVRVKVVPGLTTNLISVGQVSSNNVAVMFRGVECFFEHEGRTVCHGFKSKHNGLYQLNILPFKDETVLLIRENRRLTDWHRALGHVDNNRLNEMAKNNLVTGMKIVEVTPERAGCSQCSLGKATRVSHWHSSRERAKIVGELVHADLVGPSSVPSIGGNRYMLLLTDEASGWRVGYFMSSKADVCEHLQDYVARIESETGKRLKRLKSDQGSEFLNMRVKTLVDIEHVTLITSAAYTPEQNGAAERSNRTVIEAARTMLSSSQMPEELWAEAAGTAIYLLNRTTSSVHKNHTPYELWFGRKPSIAHIHPFGSEVQILETPRRSSKWSPKTMPAFVVGFTERANNYRCFIPGEKPKIIVSCDVIFRSHSGNTDSKVVPKKASAPETTYLPNIDHRANTTQNPPSLETHQQVETGKTCATEEALPREQLDESGSVEGVQQSQQLIESGAVEDLLSTPHEDIEIEEAPGCSRDDDGDTAQTPSTPPCLGTTFTVQTPKKTRFEKISEHWKKTQSTEKGGWWTSKGGMGGFLYLAYEEPRSYNEALASDDSVFWKKAIKAELDSLQKNQTSTLSVLPKDKRTVFARWVFKKKLLPGGSVDKYKARLVARGYTQRPGVDYDQTYAPVARYETIRFVLAIIAHKQFEMMQFDISTAFLNGVLEEEIYLQPPDGITCPPNQVLRLHKSLYGLKQSPKCWKTRLDEILNSVGLTNTSADPCLYRGFIDGEETLLVIYVDDGLVAARSKTTLMRLIEQIGRQITINEVDSKIFVGFEIEKGRDGSITIHQQSYINSMVKRFNLDDCTPAKTPITDTGRPLEQSETDTPANAPYQELVGSLNYAACICRLDISFAVGFLSRFNRAPMRKHWEAAKQTLRYLKGTYNYGLKFQANKALEIDTFSDADWASDYSTRRSISGVLVLLSGSPIIFLSRSQNLVSLSSTEAEYIAASLAGREIIWLKSMMKEISLEPTRTTLHIDNQSAIKLIKNPTFQARTKHIDARVHHIRHMYTTEEIDINNVTTDEQQADILTKALPPRVHSTMVSKIGFTTLMCCLMTIITPASSAFGVEDLVVWRPTKIAHVYGQNTLELDLSFQDPCFILFSNLTTVPLINQGLVQVCSRRFNSSVVDTLDTICADIHTRVSRDAGLAAMAGGAMIAGVSAVVASSYYSFTNNDRASQSEKMHSLVIRLEKQVGLLRESMVVINNRTTDRIRKIERDVHFLGATVKAQPEIIDAMVQVLFRFDEAKIKLRKVRESLTIGKEVPHVLLEIFNMTDLVTSSTLHHSSLLSCKNKHKSGVRLVISLLKFSNQVEVVKADPFVYWSAHKDKMCKFVYTGPDYILFNHTSNCARPLLQGEVIDDVILGDGCTTRKAISNNRTYEPILCEKVSKNDIKIPPIQIKHTGETIQLNCQGHYISIDGNKTQCPNNIFRISQEKSFTINDYHYSHQATNITRPHIEYSIPTKINLMLGISHVEFNSFTADELHNLQNSANEDVRKNFADELTTTVEESHISWIGRLVGTFVDWIGEYLAVLIFLFLIYAYIRSRMARMNNIAPVAVVILLLSPIILGHDHLFKVQQNREKATEDIVKHQEYIKNNWCNEWRFADEQIEFENNEGYYPVSLSCLLAQRDYTCPCSPAAEWVPIVRHDQVDELIKYDTGECPSEQAKLEKNEVEQIDLLETISHHLCVRAKGDNWPRIKYSKLIAASCLLSRKMYNCACVDFKSHKSIIFDKLTIKATKDINESMEANKQKCTEKLKEDPGNQTSVFELYYDLANRNNHRHEQY